MTSIVVKQSSIPEKDERLKNNSLADRTVRIYNQLNIYTVMMKNYLRTRSMLQFQERFTSLRVYYFSVTMENVRATIQIILKFPILLPFPNSSSI